MRGSGALFALLFAACIRNPKDLPGAQEGGFVSGNVVEQSLITGDLSGVSGALISEIGTNTKLEANQDGRFIFERLPIGRNIYLDIRKPRRPMMLPSSVRRLPPFKILVDGQMVPLGEIRLGENGALEGRVLLEVEGTAPIGAGGTAVVVATTAFKGLTSEDGSFFIPSVPEGSFEIVAFRPGYRPARASGVTVSPAVTVRTRDLIMEMGDAPNVSLSGEATLADADTGGHAGTQVMLVDELDPEVTFGPATTDGEGRYQLDVAAGVYRARITHDGYRSVELEGVAALEEGVIGLLRVTLSRGGSQLPGDSDGDGCADTVDEFPADPFACFDNDDDGIPDELDPDDDNDGLNDFEELSAGRDGFVTDPFLPDTDLDAFSDADDNCPTIPNADQDPSVCAGGNTMRLPPEILSFEPNTGTIGTIVAITGRNFVASSPTSVQFGAGAIAVASSSSVSETRLVVRVPRFGLSGPLTVISGGQVDTSNDAFTVIPPPQILRVVPPSARENGAFAVHGLDVEGGEIFIGGVGTLPRGCTAAEMDQSRPGEQVVCGRVAPGTTTGRIEVRTSVGGPSLEAITFAVLSGPIIYELRPNPTARGIPLTIVGDGFDTTDTGGNVTVEFTGSAAPATPTRVRNNSIDVVVPNDAITGVVRVVHPAGNAESPGPLTIDDGTPLIYDFDHTLVQAGDTLIILGRHLANASAVTFGGGAAGTGISSTDGQITVTVPAGVDPGPVTATVMAGPVTSSVRLSVLEIGADLFVEDLVPGVGLSLDDQTLYALTNISPPDLVLVQSANLSAPPTSVAVGGATMLPSLFAVSPDGAHGLVFETARIHVINLPSGTLVGTCPRTPSVGAAADWWPPRFDDQARYAFTRKPSDAPANDEGYLRVNMLDGTCDYFATSTTLTAPGVQGLLFDPFSGELLVSHPGRGHMYVDVQTGMTTSPLGLPTFGHAQLFRGLAGPDRIYGVGPPAGDLSAIDLFSGRQPEIIQSGIASVAAQTRNGRWLFVANSAGNTGYFVELQEERVARNNVPMVTGTHLTAALSSFFLHTVPAGTDETIRRFTIRD